MIWYEGIDNYRKCSFEQNLFTTELLDKTLRIRPLAAIFSDNLAPKQTKTVELLYSGGLDSECILNACLINKTPIRAITMRLLVNNSPINTHDLYYSEKFCRENNVEQKIVDLDVKKFFDNGEHLRYLLPYSIEEPHVATHFWLFEQCTGFPVIGGDYTWPWQSRDNLSPHRLSYSCYGRFLRDNGIDGIGNMLGHSIDSNYMLMQKHLEFHDPNNMTNYTKKQVYESLGLGKFELRFRSYGWESFAVNLLNKTQYKIELLKEIGIVKNNIKWNNVIGSLLNGPGTNSRFFQ